MVSWGKAFLTSLICVAWCFLWIFLGGSIIISSLFTPVANSREIPIRFVLVIIGFIIFGLPYNTAFFKFFPGAVNKSDTLWGEAFSGSASYFSQALGWGLLCFTFSPGVIVGLIGIRASYYQTLGKMVTGDEIEGKNAWSASGHMFGWCLLWLLVGGFIIGFSNIYLGRVYLDINTKWTILILVIITALYLMILGISAAEFKELGDVITFQEITWEEAYGKAALYALWCILWVTVGGLIIYFSLYYTRTTPIFIPPNMRFYYYYVYPIIFWAIGLFVLAWGCLSAYIKYFGDIIETW